MRTQRLFVASALALVFFAEPSAHAADELPAKEQFHLYLLIGQSNMAGRGKMTEQDRQPVPRVLKFDKHNHWVRATHPLHFDKPAIAGVGLGMTFAQAMAEQDPSITIGLIPCAVGGTPLRRWSKDGDLYNAALDRAKLAMQDGTLKGVLWHQGEGDTGSKENAETYATRLDQMIADLRADLDNAGLPLVAGGLCPAFLDRAKSSFANTVETALAELPRRVEHTGFASADGLKAKPDKTHFNADALREFGRRYAAAMQELSQKTESGNQKAEGAKPRAATDHY